VRARPTRTGGAIAAEPCGRAREACRGCRARSGRCCRGGASQLPAADVPTDGVDSARGTVTGQERRRRQVSDAERSLFLSTLDGYGATNSGRGVLRHMRERAAVIAERGEGKIWVTQSAGRQRWSRSSEVAQSRSPIFPPQHMGRATPSRGSWPACANSFRAGRADKMHEHARVAKLLALFRPP
jgi:hypothetical protein